MKDRNTGYPRGFGFVTFADPSVCDTVLRETHVIDGKTVDVKRCIPLENMAALKGPKTKKIFVGGLPILITEDEFKNHFAKFGKVVEHQIMTYHSTGRSRGFGFITFESEQSVEDVISQGTMHEFAGKQVEIKKAEPKKTTEEFMPPFGRGGRFDVGYGGYGDSYGLAGAGAYGNDSYRLGGGYIDGRGAIYGGDRYGKGSLVERSLSGGTGYGAGYGGSGVGLGPYGANSLTGGYDSLLPYESVSGPYGRYIDSKGPYGSYGSGYTGGYSSGADYGLGGFSIGYDVSRHSSSNISYGRYHPYRR
ncbi:hypothetical protein O6H91_12G009900 [Diphasiastrum complanatum]|nr:hypothetical protein O6H91_12G009900 [Diphasiastrum complanatum]